jgi:uncharacterized protein (TIGR00297 family)
MTFNHIFNIPPASDWINILILFFVISVIILISEIIRIKLHWSQEFTRKIVHISVGILLLLTPVLLETSLPLILIAVFFSVFNFVALRKGLLPGIHIDRNNYGTFYYAISFLILVLLFWGNNKIIIIASMMVMAVGDAAAAIIGKSIKNPKAYYLIKDKKTWNGSFAMFVFSFLAISLTLLLYPSNNFYVHHNLVNLFLISLVTAIFITFAEALGNRGNDNLSVPLLCGISLYCLLNGTFPHLVQFSLGMVLGGIIALLSYRAKFLSASGSVTVFLLAIIIFGFGGLKWAIPILTFFFLSSLLSKWKKGQKQKFDLIFEKGNQRDSGQVLANGGIAGFLVILNIFLPNDIWYMAYLAAIAAAMADTWATEIGILFGHHPRLITTFKKVQPGTSGGISLAGLLGSILGAAVVALSGYFFIYPNFYSSYLPMFFVTSAGVFGGLIDSLIGATIQAQFKCPKCHKITEKRKHCSGTETQQISGINWINNDIVNFINTLSGALLVFILYQ